MSIPQTTHQRPPRVIHEDDSILAIDKPAGMLVHRGWGKDDEVLVDWVKEYTQAEKVHPIHRLDRATSGVVLFAQNPTAARNLNKLFEQRQIQKHYIALVRGIAPEIGYLDHPVPTEPKGKERVPAQSSFRRLASNRTTQPRECSLVEVAPHSGRVHQIRRHMAHLNHPLIGDANYGKGKINRAFKEHYNLPGLALHAVSLRFEHPDTQELIRISTPVDEFLAASLVTMGFEPSAWHTLEQPDYEPDWLEIARTFPKT